MAASDLGPLQALRSALRTPIPRHARADLTFAAVLLALFLMQVATGILLSLYYQPSPAMVAESVRFIMRDVSSGWLIRGVHHWSSQALIVLCGLYLMRMFVAASYRRGRGAAWYVGCAVFALLLACAFSGSVLSWDDQAYWRVRRLLESVESFPLVGATLADIVRGGPKVSATTLSRTYSAHSLFAPWLVWMLLLFNAWLLLRRLEEPERGAA